MVKEEKPFLKREEREVQISEFQVSSNYYIRIAAWKCYRGNLCSTALRDDTSVEDIDRVIDGCEHVCEMLHECFGPDRCNFSVAPGPKPETFEEKIKERKERHGEDAR